MPGEWPRRLLHSFSGVVTAAIGLYLPRGIFLPIVLAVAGTFAIIDIVRFKHRRLNAWFLTTFRRFLRSGEATRITGASYMGIGAALAFVYYSPTVAALALCFLAIGDPVSGSVRAGRWPRLTGKNKSLLSSLACFAACVGVGLASRFFFGLPVVGVVAAALTATIVEALPLPVNDNVSIPVVAGGVMTAVNLLVG